MLARAVCCLFNVIITSLSLSSAFPRYPLLLSPCTLVLVFGVIFFFFFCFRSAQRKFRESDKFSGVFRRVTNCENATQFLGKSPITMEPLQDNNVSRNNKSFSDFPTFPLTINLENFPYIFFFLFRFFHEKSHNRDAKAEKLNRKSTPKYVKFEHNLCWISMLHSNLPLIAVRFGKQEKNEKI